MFSTRFKQIYFICDNLVIRTLRSRIPLGPNPGLDRRSRVFQKEGLDLDENAEDFIEESEGNFFEAGKVYKQTIKDKKKEKESLRQNIVAQKYFKEQFPNLLTWSEKEQIRYLHSQEPNEWTPERLADSFPVTAAVVKKLVKYPWRPASMERIARHDASAMRNWRELKDDTLEIPPELKKHFLKFSERTIPPLEKKAIKIDTQTKNIGQFQAIVDRCAKSEHSNETMNRDNINEVPPDNKKENIHKFNRKHFTLEELSNKIKSRLEEGHEIDVSDQMIIQNQPTESKALSEIKIQNDIAEIKEEKEITAFGNSQTGIVKVKTYPQRIRIPKKAFKKGATYKVDDCYYDFDGIFLYRVIGL